MSRTITKRYRPEYLLDYDLVVVTINYRLGPLGFLSLDSSNISGNKPMFSSASTLTSSSTIVLPMTTLQATRV